MALQNKIVYFKTLIDNIINYYIINNIDIVYIIIYR